MQRKREDEVKKLEETKKKIQEQNRVDVTGFNTKFGTSKGDVIQDELGKVTVGLVTLEQLKKHKEELAKKEQILEHLQRKEEIENEKQKREADRKNRKSKLTKSTLSFGDEAEELEEEEVEPVAKKKVVKNPTVDTSFLPDKDRELREIEERRKLTQEWHEEQERKKAEVRAGGGGADLFDAAGSGHRDNLQLLGWFGASASTHVLQGDDCRTVLGDGEEKPAGEGRGGERRGEDPRLRRTAG
eukprot:754455-Hanusia_phi.AAC.1